MWESTKLAVAELTGSSYLTCLGNVASREQNSFHRTHGGQTGRPWAQEPAPRLHATGLRQGGALGARRLWLLLPFPGQNTSVLKVTWQATCQISFPKT